LDTSAGNVIQSNNATPEAAPVTTGMEIDVMNDLLKMLGYVSPPDPPTLNEILVNWKEYEDNC